MAGNENSGGSPFGPDYPMNKASQDLAAKSRTVIEDTDGFHSFYYDDELTVLLERKSYKGRPAWRINLITPGGSIRFIDDGKSYFEELEAIHLARLILNDGFGVHDNFKTN